MSNSEDISNDDAAYPKEERNVVFSLADDGFVWVAWPGTVALVRLGKSDAVEPMMRDFLDQGEVGERLLKGASLNKRKANTP
jgi:hypothetical protein